jgi:hypothetical protein
MIMRLGVLGKHQMEMLHHKTETVVCKNLPNKAIRWFFFSQEWAPDQRAWFGARVHCGF